MKCKKLKKFQGDVDAALLALRSAKGPQRISELDSKSESVAEASRALVDHRNTCLFCSNEED